MSPTEPHRTPSLLVLHVGYHKTGTTFLQKRFFSQHPGIRYLGKPWVTREVADFFTAFSFTNALEYDAEASRLRFEGIAAALADGEEGRPIVVSQESLHTGPEWFGVSVAPMAERLRQVFPEARILLTIRNQVAYIDSFYRNYVFHGGRMSVRRFLYDSYFFQCGLGPKLLFDRVVRLYADAFGPERVMVTLHEDLKRDPASELRRICAFMGVGEVAVAADGENVGLSAVGVPWVRAINGALASDFLQEYYEIAALRPSGRRARARRVAARALRRLAEKEPLRGLRRRVLSDADVAFVTEYYAASNAALAAILGRDLKAAGYVREG